MTTTMRPPKLLIVDDGDRYAELLHQFLRDYDYVTRCDLPGPCWHCPKRQGCTLTHAHATPYDRYVIGIHHIAFAASSRATVDELAAWAREHGGEIESGPREYDYTPGYYAVFLHDPDGLKLEIVHRPYERDLARRFAELTERLERLESDPAAPDQGGEDAIRRA